MNTDRLLRGGAAHTAFDRLWLEPKGALDVGRGQRSNRYLKARRRRRQRRARDSAYGWLAQQLQIPADACHFGTFDPATLARVVAICRATDADQVRRWRQAA